MLAEDVPQVRPLQTDAAHVVVRDLDQLLQAEQPRVLRQPRGLDLLPRHVAQGLDKVHDGRLRAEISTRI